jgi:hypothetical protein
VIVVIRAPFSGQVNQLFLTITGKGCAYAALASRALAREAAWRALSQGPQYGTRRPRALLRQENADTGSQLPQPLHRLPSGIRARSATLALSADRACTSCPDDGRRGPVPSAWTDRSMAA